LRGGRAIETPFGNIVAPNITPDLQDGIGSWNDDQFDAAVRGGTRPDGSRLYPAMPYTAYTKMSHDDILAIRAYLNTVTPLSSAPAKNALPFPFKIRSLMRLWDGLYFKRGEFEPDPKQSPEWNRGAFLVEGPAHCGACHTPKTFLGGDKHGEYLQGSQLQGWFSPNITNDTRLGLGNWQVDDVVAYLKTGHNRVTAATGPMAEAVSLSSSQLADADLRAIAIYLKAVPGTNAALAPLPPQDPRMSAGEAIYRDQCSACHALDGKGTPRLFPSIADSSLVRSVDPATLVLRMICAIRNAPRAHFVGPIILLPSVCWRLCPLPHRTTRCLSAACDSQESVLNRARDWLLASHVSDD
jgi:mono/diheme cytochrome c family protein